MTKTTRFVPRYISQYDQKQPGLVPGTYPSMTKTTRFGTRVPGEHTPYKLLDTPRRKTHGETNLGGLDGCSLALCWFCWFCIAIRLFSACSLSVSGGSCCSSLFRKFIIASSASCTSIVRQARRSKEKKHSSDGEKKNTNNQHEYQK